MVDITIIVPAYNVGKYIEKCMNSLVNQTKKEIEIIAIDDGSTDNTLEILKKYESEYKDLVKVFHQENKGQSLARNLGIENASGKYVGFVDSDDEIELDLLEKLWEKVKEFSYDAVAFDVNCIYPNRQIIIKSGVETDEKQLSKEQKNNFLLNMYSISCNKIYKKDIFKDKKLLFYPGVWFEDVLFLYKIIPSLKSIAKIDYPGYKYYQREKSVTYTYSDRLKDINNVLEKLLDYYNEAGLYKEYRDELEYIYVRYMYATFIKRLSKSKDKKRFNDGVKFAKQCVNKRFPQYKKNKYLKRGVKSMYLRHFNEFVANFVYILEKNKMN